MNGYKHICGLVRNYRLTKGETLKTNACLVCFIKGVKLNSQTMTGSSAYFMIALHNNLPLFK